MLNVSHVLPNAILHSANSSFPYLEWHQMTNKEHPHKYRNHRRKKKNTRLFVIVMILLFLLFKPEVPYFFFFFCSQPRKLCNQPWWGTKSGWLRWVLPKAVDGLRGALSASTEALTQSRHNDFSKMHTLWVPMSQCYSYFSFDGNINQRFNKC